MAFWRWLASFDLRTFVGSVPVSTGGFWTDWCWIAGVGRIAEELSTTLWRKKNSLTSSFSCSSCQCQTSQWFHPARWWHQSLRFLVVRHQSLAFPRIQNWNYFRSENILFCYFVIYLSDFDLTSMINRLSIEVLILFNISHELTLVLKDFLVSKTNLFTFSCLTLLTIFSYFLTFSEISNPGDYS